MSTVGASESAAVGCNWNFAPVVDLLLTGEIPLCRQRAFNDSPEDTIRYAKAFMRGAKGKGFATCCKHFPGDGTEEERSASAYGYQ